MAKAIFHAKRRRCACCGVRLRKLDLRLCRDCVRDPLLARTYCRSREKVRGAKLLALAQDRQAAGLHPLEGMSLEEINGIAGEYSGTAFHSYGRLREYVRSTGKLPPLR